MAQIKCPDCGHAIMASAPSCIYCGRSMAAPAAEPAKQPAPPPVAPTKADLDATGWLLCRGDRQFGPMTGHELVVYFTSKMVTADDTVTGPCWPDHVTAIDAAALLQAPAPAIAPSSTSSTSAVLAYSPVEPTPIRNLEFVLWLVFLFGLQLIATVHKLPMPLHSRQELLFDAGLQFLAIAVACFAVIGVLGRQIRGKFPSAVVPLIAMTLIYGALLGKSFLFPEPDPETATAQSESPAKTDQPPASEFVVTRPPGSPEGDQLVKLGNNKASKDWYAFAKTFQDKGDWQGMLNMSLQWTALEPDNADAWVYLGAAYSSLKQDKEALKANQRAVELAPTHAHAWTNLSNNYLDLGQYLESEAAARRAVLLDDSSAVAWNNLGAALQAEDRQDEALDGFKHAVAADPNFAIAWANVGTQYFRRKQYPEARAAFNKALALDPSNQVAAMGIENVQQMQKVGGG